MVQPTIKQRFLLIRSDRALLSTPQQVALLANSNRSVFTRPCECCVAPLPGVSWQACDSVACCALLRELAGDDEAELQALRESGALGG
jgi:hypothetical protein